MTLVWPKTGMKFVSPSQRGTNRAAQSATYADIRRPPLHAVAIWPEGSPAHRDARAPGSEITVVHRRVAGVPNQDAPRRTAVGRR